MAKRELFEIGWYAFALVHFLTGRRLRRVYASTGAYFSSRHRELDVEDFAVVALELEGGAVATVSAGRTGRASHPGHGRMALRVTGTGGALQVDGGRPGLDALADAVPLNTVGRDIPGVLDAFGAARQVDGFVDCLDGAAPPHWTRRPGATWCTRCSRPTHRRRRAPRWRYQPAGRTAREGSDRGHDSCRNQANGERRDRAGARLPRRGRGGVYAARRRA